MESFHFENVLSPCAGGCLSSSCRHLPAKGLRICSWNTRGLLGSAASSQRPREKLRYHSRIAEKSDILCLQETHVRIEHLANIDIVLDCTIRD